MLPEDYQPILKEVISRYSMVSDQSLSGLYKAAKVDHFRKNEIILPVGEIAKNIHVISKGAAVSYFIDAEGNAYHKNIFLEGDFVGSTVSCLTQLPSQFALQSIEATTVISIPYKKYRQLISEKRDLKDFYIAYLEKNWVIDKEEREVALVMKSATARYLELLDKHPQLDKRIPLNYIASHLGITPTQLSRIRKSLKN